MYVQNFYILGGESEEGGRERRNLVQRIVLPLLDRPLHLPEGVSQCGEPTREDHAGRPHRMQALREAEVIRLTRQEPLPLPPCFPTLRGHWGQGDDHHRPPHPTRSRNGPFPPAPVVVARSPPLPTALERLPAQRVARALLPRAPIARC